jgi:hypothetical protein
MQLPAQEASVSSGESTNQPSERRPKTTLETSLSNGNDLTFGTVRFSAAATLPIDAPEKMLLVKPFEVVGHHRFSVGQSTCFHQLSNSLRCPLSSSNRPRKTITPEAPSPTSPSPYTCSMAMAKGGRGELPFCPNLSGSQSNCTSVGNAPSLQFQAMTESGSSALSALSANSAIRFTFWGAVAVGATAQSRERPACGWASCRSETGRRRSRRVCPCL